MTTVTSTGIAYVREFMNKKINNLFVLTSLSVAQEQLSFYFLFSIYKKCALRNCFIYNVFLILAEKSDVINEKPINATTF